MSALVMLLLSLGGSLGAAFIKNPALQGVVATAVSAAGSLITNLLNKKPGESIALPTFILALQSAISILAQTGKITAEEAIELNKALTDMAAADNAAQLVIDPTLLAEPLPTL